MPKPPAARSSTARGRVSRVQLGVRISPEALAILAVLQDRYGTAAGLMTPFSQSQAIDKLLRDTARREKISLPPPPPPS